MIIPKQEDDLVARFRGCYEENYRSIRRYVARLSGDPADADDLAQETFARLWREFEGGNEIRNPRAWLYRVSGNLVVSRFRSNVRASAYESEVVEMTKTDVATAFDIERAAIFRQIVPKVLKRLPEPMRKCLLLYHEGLTGPEIAGILGVKPSYVGTLVVRAHERFRRECEEFGNAYNLLG